MYVYVCARVCMCSDEEVNDSRRRREHEKALSGSAREIHLPYLVQHIPALRPAQQVAAQLLHMDARG